ncbi:galactoside alpha-(1,2)-fucosyltransferase 1-like [Mytilus edulis]
MQLIVGENTEINRVFNIDVDVRPDVKICQTFNYRHEKQSSAYDDSLLRFNNSQNVRLVSCLQSWKYFYEFRNELRKQLTFRRHIQIEAEHNIRQIMQKINEESRKVVTLVGVHIRLGDIFISSRLKQNGFVIATPEYLSKSVDYFLSKYRNVLFLVTSQNMTWAKANMPRHVKNKVEYIDSPKWEVIVATLSLCDHTITTVGSFSWWIGWLTGGEVTYYKWPVRDGSVLGKQFNYSDYFYPGWIGF